MKPGVIILLLLLVFGLPESGAQEVKLNVKYLGVNNGLTSANIRNIVQDKFGFIWIATQDGLFRYDSRDFVSYNTLSSPGKRIGGSDVRQLQIDTTANRIWLTASYGGINAIDLLSGQVVKYISQDKHRELNQNLIKTFFVNGNMILLGCERGLFKYDIAADSIKPVSIPGHASEDIYVDVLYRLDTDKVLLLCRNTGAFIYDMNSGQLTVVPFAKRQLPLQFYNCTDDRNGHFFITSSQGPIACTYDKTGFSVDSGNSMVARLNKYTVRRAAFDHTGKLWLSTSNGLFLYEKNVLSAIKSNDERNQNNDWLKAVYNIYVDDYNDIWLGCQNGLAWVKNRLPAFTIHSYSESTDTRINHSYYLFPLNDSIIYSTAEEGLFRINKKDNSIHIIEKGKTYDFIFKDPFGMLIVSNSDGLFKLLNDKKIPIGSLHKEFIPFSKYRINSAVEINDSCIAMGTENGHGILIWNFVAHRVENFYSKSQQGALPENIVNNLFHIASNEFLVLSDAHVTLFDYRKKQARPIVLTDPENNKPFSIFFDACKLRDTLYIASYGQAVLKLNNQYQYLGKITSVDGLSNNGIYKLLPWNDSLLFITTNNGLNCYYPSKSLVRKFFKQDGLQDNSFEETSGNIYKNAIYAGGINGFVSINPERMAGNELAPKLYINQVVVDRPGEKKIDTANLLFSEFHIPRNSLQTTVFFSAINYTNPERVNFFYKIAELHKDWINLGNQNFITLIGLSPGTYHLHVTCYNEDGIQAEPRELTLVLLPKWYQTWWFKVLVLLIVMGGAYIIYIFRINQLKQIQVIRNKLASDLHDDLGSTMNSVKVFANLAIHENGAGRYLEKVKECAQEAITSIRDMIWVLDDEKDTVENLLARIYSFAAPLCEAGRVTYAPHLTEEARYHKLGQEERRNLYMMMKEAVNNAFKYSQGNKIELAVSLKKNKLEITIQDNGTGFDPQNTNAGSGLKNMNRRAKAINYQFRIDSIAGTGTKIYLREI